MLSYLRSPGQLEGIRLKRNTALNAISTREKRSFKLDPIWYVVGLDASILCVTSVYILYIVVVVVRLI